MKSNSISGEVLSMKKYIVVNVKNVKDMSHNNANYAVISILVVRYVLFTHTNYFVLSKSYVMCP